jgi:beta-glucanase (GH16 family)
MEARTMSIHNTHARWTRAWRVVAVLLAAGLVPCAAIGSRLANAETSTSAKVVFRDDFSGKRLDASHWNASWFGSGSAASNPVNSKEDDCYDPKQVSVQNGYLVLAAIPHSCLGHAYMSGLVNSDGKFNFTTGTLSARVWLPGENSTVDWPGVWTDGRHWPDDGEVDLVEGLDGHDCWHVHSVKPTVGDCAAITGGWHIVKYVRTTSSLTFYYDGKKIGSASTSSFARSPHYLVLNLAVSKSVSPPEKPALMLVDWVEVTT